MITTKSLKIFFFLSLTTIANLKWPTLWGWVNQTVPVLIFAVLCQSILEGLHARFITNVFQCRFSDIIN